MFFKKIFFFLYIQTIPITNSLILNGKLKTDKVRIQGFDKYRKSSLIVAPFLTV